MEKKQEFDQQMETFSESDGETSTNILDEWDSDDGICSSRSPVKTCKRIGKLFLFLFCFFGFIMLFSIGVMILFNDIFDGERHEEVTTPVEVTTQVEITTHHEILIFDSKIPQLIFVPRINKDDALIRCTNDASRTRPYVKRMTSFIKGLNLMSSNSQDCNENITRNMEKPCRFSMSQLGNVCVKKRKYGFNDCRVCIALTLNKVINWQPIAYDNGSVPMEISDRYHDNAVTVSCHGVRPVDDENMGPITYYPPEGFHFKYFPYQEQEGYNTPLVMVHFKNPIKFTYIDVECKVWAKNIDHSRNEGITKFELYLE